MLSVLRRVRGAYAHPVEQSIRSANGVRGVFARTPVERGGLLLSVPLRYCYLPDGLLASAALDAEELGTAEAMHLRRCNREAALLPEFHRWVVRLSPDATGDRVALTSSSSDGEDVSSVHLTPVEAAVVVSVALRYFFGPALGLPEPAQRRLMGPASDYSLADRYVASLPIALCLSHGVESLFTAAGEGSAEHQCLEQISCNLRDACLTFATPEQYRFMDENPSVFDGVLLTVLYLVRARVLRIPLLAPRGESTDRHISVLAPGLDALNHADGSAANAAAVLAPAQRRVAVRATRPISRGEELTINYGTFGAAAESRYLIGENHRLLGTSVDPSWFSQAM